MHAVGNDVSWSNENVKCVSPKSTIIDEELVAEIQCVKSEVITQTVEHGSTTNPPSCEHVQSPSNLQGPPVEIDYTLLNDGFPFGTSNDTNAIANFRVDQYLEISDLRTDQENFRRKLQFYPTPSNLNSPYVLTMSISECPGDFTVTAVCTRSIVVTTFPQVRVSTYPNDDPNTFCLIETNKSYYLNFIHDQFPFDGAPGRCGFTSNNECAVFFNEQVDQ